MSKKDCIMKGYDIEATNALLSNGMAEDIDDDVSSINLKKEESFVHMQDEHTYNPLVTAGSLKVEDVVYDGKTNHRLRVIDVKDGNNSWTKTITWKDLEDNRIFTTNPGINALFELKVEGDKEFEVDDDIDFEFHPIDTYFENFTEDMDSVTNEEVRLDVVNNAIDALHDMGYDYDFIGDYVHIEVKDTEDGRIKVEVRGEFNYEELSELSNRLNKVVSKYDKYAYFDMEDSGIASAYILKDQSDYVVSEEVVKAFAELIDACKTREDLKKVYTEHIGPSAENDVINNATFDEILNIFDKKLDALVDDETKLDESKSIKESTLNEAKEMNEKLNTNPLKDLRESDEETPYTKEEVERELKSFTHNFTDKKGELKCGFEEEKNFCVEILKQHYNVVEVSGDDRREGTWYHISFAKPKLNEELEKTGADGWGDDVEDILDDVFDKIYKIAYEVKHTVRGVYVDGKKVEDLADELKGIKNMLDDAIDELEDNAERINESTPNVSEKLNTSTKTFSQWFDETQPKYDDKFYPFSNYIKSFESAEVLKDATAMDIVKNAHRFYDAYPVDSADREKAFIFASKELGIKYDDLYDAWLNDQPIKLDKHESIKESCDDTTKPIKESISSDDKRKALADYLDVDVEDVVQTYDENSFEVKSTGEEYIVADYDTAYDLAEQDVINTIDDLGINAFTPDFQEWIMDYAVKEDWFEDALAESQRYYYEDMDEDEFIEVCKENDISPDDENAIDELVDIYLDGIDDYVAEFKSIFGDSEFSTAVKENDLIDLDKVAEEAISIDGIAHFIAVYDGEEIELSDDLFAYRTN